MKRGLVVLLLGILFLVVGCGMMGIHSGHGSNHNSGEMKSAGTKMIIKELRQNGFRIELEVPPLFAGVAAGITIRLWNEQLKQPVRAGTVFVYTKTYSDDRLISEDIETDFDYEYEAAELENGIYKIALIPDKIGLMKFRTEISLAEDTSELFVLEATQEIVQANKKMKPKNNFTLLAILGGIGMVSMMFFMWGWDHH